MMPEILKKTALILLSGLLVHGAAEDDIPDGWKGIRADGAETQVYTEADYLVSTKSMSWNEMMEMSLPEGFFIPENEDWQIIGDKVLWNDSETLKQAVAQTGYAAWSASEADAKRGWCVRERDDTARCMKKTKRAGVVHFRKIDETQTNESVPAGWTGLDRTGAATTRLRDAQYLISASKMTWKEMKEIEIPAGFRLPDNSKWGIDARTCEWNRDETVQELVRDIGAAWSKTESGPKEAWVVEAIGAAARFEKTDTAYVVLFR